MLQAGEPNPSNTVACIVLLRIDGVLTSQQLRRQHCASIILDAWRAIADHFSD